MVNQASMTSKVAEAAFFLQFHLKITQSKIILIYHKRLSMELYTLKRQFNGYKKGTQFYLITESEFIGVKEFVLRTKDLTKSITINESELLKNFIFIKEIFFIK
ncbi:hypothetical protein ABE288_06995 [Bacillus salipaludis]|uniref:hypothetical protein n=1 Tax=Bacillus salipaludis TaxID=2547811 RepID=UPI003D206EFE